MEAIAEELAENGASALLLNCSSPEAITQAMPVLAKFGLPFGAYANGFVAATLLGAGGTVAHLEARQDLDPSSYALQWLDAGATIIGGCCEVGPAHIAELANALSKRGHRIVGA